MTTPSAGEAMAAAKEAKSMIAAHEKVCAERYGRIDDGLNTVKEDVGEVKTDMKDITNRINILLIGVGGCMFTVILALVFKS